MAHTATGPTDPATLILISLAGGSKHGYAMITDIAENFDVTLGAGTLYGALARLEEAGQIRPIESKDRRRPYELTPSGVTAAKDRAAQLRAVADLGMKRLRKTGLPAGGLA